MFLRTELIRYGSALTAMSRLEAKHHLQHTALSFGRGAMPWAVCAMLRRKANTDVLSDAFRQNIEQYLSEFHRLVPEEWHSRRELLQIVYGYSSTSLHANLQHANSMLDRYKQVLRVSSVSTRKKDPDHTAWLEYINWALTTGHYYALPVSPGSNDYAVFCFLDANPASKRYVERLTCLSDDVAWLE
jgi:hypothetical protein